MHEIVAIGTRDFALGFKSAGVSSSFETDNPEEARQLIKEFTEKRAAVILIAESLAVKIIDFIEKTVEEKTIPSVVVLKDETPTQKLGYSLLRKSVEKAIGIDLMKQER